MYEEFKRDDEMIELARVRETARNLDESHKMEYRDIGRQEGREEGMHQTLITNCQKAILKLFHQDALSWLESLTKNQLDYVFELIFEEENLESLKKKVNES